MLCQKCGTREANTYVKSIVNGTLSAFSLCSSCAAEMGYANFLSNFTFNSLVKGADSLASTADHCCPVCGMQIGEILKLGKLGCSACYGEFADRLQPAIQRIHGTAQHKGKIPGRAELLVPIAKKEMSVVEITPVKQKHKLLQLAIAEQRFEDAALLRDEIKALRNQEGSE